MVDARSEVLLDGGVRVGTDPLVALALGARAVLLGRPVAYALAVGGRMGVRDALASFTRDLAQAMALVGTPSVGDVTRARVR